MHSNDRYKLIAETPMDRNRLTVQKYRMTLGCWSDSRSSSTSLSARLKHSGNILLTATSRPSNDPLRESTMRYITGRLVVGLTYIYGIQICIKSGKNEPKVHVYRFVRTLKQRISVIASTPNSTILTNTNHLNFSLRCYSFSR